MTVKYLTYRQARVLTEIHDCEVFVIPIYENFETKRVIRILAEDGMEYRINNGDPGDGEKKISTFGGIEGTVNSVFKGNVQHIHLVVPPLPDNLDLKSMLAQMRKSKVPSK